MKRIVYLFISMFLSWFSVHSQSRIIKDTIDCGGKMVILEIPSVSQKLAVLHFYTEGFFITYPLSSSREKIIFARPCPLISLFCGSLMEDEIWEMKYDKLLFDKTNPTPNIERALSFVINGRFFRVDRYKSGMEVSYRDILPNQKEKADNILDSIEILPISTEKGDFINNKKKRKINFETGERIDW